MTMIRPRNYTVSPIGIVRSSIKRREDAPMQPDEGTPGAWIEIDPSFADALHGIEPGQQIVLITFLHQAQRDVLQVHPRGDRDNPLTGVFATRSPARPNPIGLHTVEVVEIDDTRIRVDRLEAIDGTPVLDIKRAL
jgi:tRNA-Thr(GGU) m(6)t(6)A37 methyltransferase TsaA